MSEQGRKYDGGKLRYDLIPVLALEETAKVVTKGAEKYDDENWKLVPEGRRRYLAAAMRHIQQWRKGEIYDDEMGTHHIANAISNLMFILEKELQGWEDVPEQQDISQEELETYVGNLVEYNTLPHRLVANPIEELWYPPVEDGENPWVEHMSSVRPVEEDTRVEILFRHHRQNKVFSSEIFPAWKLDWEKYNGDYCIIAYRIVD